MRENCEVHLIVGAPQQFLAVVAIRQLGVSLYGEVVAVCFHQLLLLVKLLSSMQPEHVAPHALLGRCLLIARFATQQKLLLHNLSCLLADLRVEWVVFGNCFPFCHFVFRIL